MGMGVATLFVLTLLERRHFVDQEPRSLTRCAFRRFIVVIASFVTVVQLCMEAYVPDLYATLGVLHPADRRQLHHPGTRRSVRFEKRTCADSALDGIGIGFGFTLSLTLAREPSAKLLGNRLGVRPGIHRRETEYCCSSSLPGAFMVLAYLMAIFNKADG